MPLKRRTGYLFASQADLPGLPAGTKLGITERDIFNCCHCSVMVVMNPERTRARNLCHKCDLYTCERPGCIGDCNPMAESVELALKHPGIEVGWVARHVDGSVMFDKGLFVPAKSYRQRPREVL